MRNIFLGPVWHWLLAVALCILGWLAGSVRLHVTSFNPFLIVLLAVTVVAIVIVLATSKPGARVTREDIEDHDAP